MHVKTIYDSHKPTFEDCYFLLKDKTYCDLEHALGQGIYAGLDSFLSKGKGRREFMSVSYSHWLIYRDFYVTLP